MCITYVTERDGEGRDLFDGFLALVPERDDGDLVVAVELEHGFDVLGLSSHAAYR